MTRWTRALGCLLAILFAAPALAEKRVALVIGNSAYRHAPALANPKNDAEGVAASLQRLKFEVLLGVDLDKRGLEALLQRFSEKLDKADVALVFYAGHGLQVNGRNYLVPVDGKLDREADLHFQAVSLDLVQSLMEQTQRTSIVILDACRDNPLARNLARAMGTRSAGIGRGLAQTQAGLGTLIVYATQPGNVALDGEGKNSPFTAALLSHLETQGLEIRQVLTRVRTSVIETTRGKQVPWDSSSLTGDFYFAAAATKPPATTPPPVSSTPPPPTDNEGLFWSSIKDSSNIAHFKAYLARWPEGVFAALAKIKVEELEKAAVRADEEKKRKDDEARKEIPAKIASARQSIKDARAALAAKRYADAKRHAAAATTASDQVTKGDANSSDGQTLARDVASLSKDVADALTAYVRPRLARARQLVNAARFDEAKRILDEAAQLVEGSADVAAARREYDAARAKAPTVRKPDAATPDAPRARGSPIAEMRRKALARENENGFCGSTEWPRYDSSREQEFLSKAAIGSVLPRVLQSSLCNALQIVRRGTTQEGNKCVIAEEIICATSCFVRSATYQWKNDWREVAGTTCR